MEVCEVLLEAGAKVDEKDNDGKGPLMLAAQEGHCRYALYHFFYFILDLYFAWILIIHKFLDCWNFLLKNGRPQLTNTLMMEKQPYGQCSRFLFIVNITVYNLCFTKIVLYQFQSGCSRGTLRSCANINRTWC